MNNLQYTIFRSDREDKLIDMVQKAISQHWKPLGGISAVVIRNLGLIRNEIEYIQAMVKEAEN